MTGILSRLICWFLVVVTGATLANGIDLTAGLGFTASNCIEAPVSQSLSDPPFENYFYSDCHSASQLIVTSPLPDSDLTIIGPRVLASVQLAAVS